MPDHKTAGIIIIGNEILSGKVSDVNSYFLARELRQLGIDVRRISVIPDEVKIIGDEVSQFSARYDFVFTSGGVGPTHDDVTMAGIAEGFQVELVRSGKIEDMLRSGYKRDLNDAMLKMTRVPEGAEIIHHDTMRFPVVVYKNVFIFPGIPDYVKNKFTAIKERFRAGSFFIKKLYLDTHESDITEILNRVVDENDDVSFGSYPVLNMPDYRVIITAESRSEGPLQSAMDSLLQSLPQNVVVRVE
jgi:molybdenum cofactor synthesis domain-containing protein